ncbi:MAG: MarR family transcriptional regulator [Thermoleophilales bacterium]|nr:MarR family transcriptional regulator [Thermoleophilales bacterium]
MSRSAPEIPAELTGSRLEVIRSFKNAYRTLSRRKGRETHRLGASEVSQAQFELLVELRKDGPMAIGELAQVTGLSPASVSQMVDRLSDQGHVERIRSDEDRRIVKVDLSDQGRSTIAPIIESWHLKWIEALDGLSDSDLEAASKVLDRIAAIYEEPERH